MAIASVNDLLAGLLPAESFLKTGATTVAGRHFSLAYSGGRPGAIAAPAAGVTGEALTTLLGQIPYSNPGGGDLGYLARFAGWASQPGHLILVDRLWQNSGLDPTSTGSQAVNSVAFPARDRSGSANGDDIIIGLEVRTVMGAGTPTLTLGYTNSDGTAGRSSVSAAVDTTMAAGSFIPLGLQAGDKGVRSIQTFQQSATMTSGAYHLVAYRTLAAIPVTSAGMGASMDALALGLPRLYDNTVPMLLWLPNGTTAPNVGGQITFAQN